MGVLSWTRILPHGPGKQWGVRMVRPETVGIHLERRPKRVETCTPWVADPTGRANIGVLFEDKADLVVGFLVEEV